MSELPSGTVTFLFTDIEGSTKLAQQYRDALPSLLARHHAILQQAIQKHNGYVFQIIGDAFCAAFHTAPDALNAALDAQRALQTEAWTPAPIHVRMGINTGSAQTVSDDDRSGGYRGYAAMARVQRVMSTAYGEQILVSNSSAELVRGELAPDISLRDMGEHRLKGLLNPEHLWQVVAPDLRQEFPPLQTLNAIPNNLPIQVTSFVGREQEIAQAKQLLENARLLTLTGSGGTGKTRLSLQIAAEVLDTFQDGVWFVELAPLSDSALVPNTVASVLGLREQAERPLLEIILDYFRNKRALLILDNCEHLIEACAKFAHAILHSSRETHILATSREALGIAGETAYRVPSLEIPNLKDVMTFAQLEHYAAVRLFIERATQAMTTFSVTNANAPAVAQICFRLDGIPLAIELAAARVKALSVEKIAERLDDRFRLLTGGSRTALPRQQTLRSAIDWSHSLLTEPERVLFRRLSVFAGGWTLDAAEEVCAGDSIESFEVLDLLTHLVDKSLVVMDEHHAQGIARYRFLETIRQYAREKLLDSNEGEAIRNRHLDYFLKFAEQAEPRLHGPEQYEWMDLLEIENDNLRAALEWSIGEGRVEKAVRLGEALMWFWDMRAYWNEGLMWMERLLKEPELGARTMTRATALSVASRMLGLIGDSLQSVQYLEELVPITREHGVIGRRLLAFGLGRLSTKRLGFNPSTSERMIYESLAIARSIGDEWLVASLLNFSGQIFTGKQDHQSALNVFEESVAKFKSLGDKYWTAVVSFQISNVYFREGEYAKARKGFQEILSFFQQTNDRLRMCFVLNGLGEIARAGGTYDLAKRYYANAFEIAQELGEKFQIAGILGNLGVVALHDGELDSARALFRESLARSRELQNLTLIVLTIRGFGYVAAVTKQSRQAVRLIAISTVLLEKGDMRFVQPPDKVEYERYLTLVRQQLNEEDFRAAWEEGRALTIEQAIELALSV